MCHAHVKLCCQWSLFSTQRMAAERGHVVLQYRFMQVCLKSAGVGMLCRGLLLPILGALPVSTCPSTWPGCTLPCCSASRVT